MKEFDGFNGIFNDYDEIIFQQFVDRPANLIIGGIVS